MFQHTTGGDISEGRQSEWLKEEGTYHVVVNDVTDQPTYRGGDKAGRLRPGIALEVTFQILAGTTPGQENKLFSQSFFANDSSQTPEQRERNDRTFDRFWVATSTLTPEQAQTKGVIYDIDLEKLIARQLMIKVSKKTDGHLTCWSDFWHVDDPAVKGKFPVDKKMLGSYPPALRWIPATQPVVQQPTQPVQSTPGAGLSQSEIASL